MDSNSQPDALLSRWTLEGRIPLSGVAEGASWRRARSVATGQDVVLFIVQGETALEAADAVRLARWGTMESRTAQVGGMT